VPTAATAAASTAAGHLPGRHYPSGRLDLSGPAATAAATTARRRTRLVNRKARIPSNPRLHIG
jgi:hypothetical protein